MLLPRFFLLLYISRNQWLCLASATSSGTRQRHILLIRAAQKLKPYGPAARTCLLKAMIEAAKTKEDLADLMNVALEELARECFELPPFATLDKAAPHVRAITTRGLYRQISQAIPIYSLEVQAAVWSPNGRYIASGGYEGTVQVWNAR